MKPKFVPTKWQRRHRELLDEVLLNPDVYLELGFIRRDTNSILKIDDSEAYINERILRLMSKYKIELATFDVLKKFCQQGGDFDYNLISKQLLTEPTPKAKKHPQAKLHRTIYNMWIQQLMTIAEITDILIDNKTLNGYTRIDDIQRVSKIIKRMNARDVNRDRSFGPTPGRRLKREEKT
ncbi:MAG TPA: hypothetical protein VII94_02665 [Candidatus Saccharimonadales bacterium]